jgi:hypothetical protein
VRVGPSTSGGQRVVRVGKASIPACHRSLGGFQSCSSSSRVAVAAACSPSAAVELMPAAVAVEQVLGKVQTSHDIFVTQHCTKKLGNFGGLVAAAIVGSRLMF